MKTVVITKKFQDAWTGSHSTKKVLNLAFYSEYVPKAGKMYSDFFDSENVLTTFVAGRGRVPLKGFEWMEVEKSENNGSMNRVIAFPSNKHFTLLVALLMRNDYKIVVKEEYVKADPRDAKANKYIFG